MMFISPINFMNDCFFCGPTDNPLTEEHVWPQWVSKLLCGKFGSDHFVRIRSTGSDTTGRWKAPVLKVTTKTVCDKCNNEWLSVFENNEIKPLATPLILGDAVDLIKPADQWKLAAWIYKMTMLLEIATPQEERSLDFFTAAERLDFRKTMIPNERVRVFLANYKCDQVPAHANQHRLTLTRREDQVSVHLKITTITAGCMAMQVVAVRSVDTGLLMYATSEMQIEFQGKVPDQG